MVLWQDFEELHSFLEANGLLRWKPLFVEHEITFDALLHFEERDLRDLGIARGPQVKIIRTMHRWRGERAAASMTRHFIDGDTPPPPQQQQTPVSDSSARQRRRALARSPEPQRRPAQEPVATDDSEPQEEANGRSQEQVQRSLDQRRWESEQDASDFVRQKAAAYRERQQLGATQPSTQTSSGQALRTTGRSPPRAFRSPPRPTDRGRTYSGRRAAMSTSPTFSPRVGSQSMLRGPAPSALASSGLWRLSAEASPSVSPLTSLSGRPLSPPSVRPAPALASLPQQRRCAGR